MNSWHRDIKSSLPDVATGLLNGEPVEAGSAQVLPVISPQDGSELIGLAESDASAVNRAVKCCRAAFAAGIWSHASVPERQTVLYKVAELIRENAEELATLDTLATGLLFHSSTLMQASAAANWFTYFAELIGTTGDQIFQQKPLTNVMVTREPVGVTALFTPWNIPLMGASLKLAAALSMGNSCVIKPSEQSPLGTIRLVQLIHEAGLPTGVLQLVNGRGAVTGAALAAHQEIDLISFTGGENAGRIINSEASQRFAKTTMELGGKSANIIFADADIDAAIQASLQIIYSNTGQACLAGSRILVHRNIADHFIADFVAGAEKLRIDQPFAEEADLGPISSEQHMQKILSYADIVRDQGGKILTGGQVASGFDKGFYIEPTVALAQDNNNRVCQEEIFGPFATFLIFNSDEQAIAMANDTRFGLAAYLWTESLKKALSVSDQLRSGSVFINTAVIREQNAPFGGFGHSGIGREGGRWSLDFYSETKARVIPYG